MADFDARLDELTGCSICLKTFEDPRILSCIHTFCLHCLEQFVSAEEKKPGEKMPCPLCKTDFVIPDDGVKDIKKNFFMEQLIDMKKLGRNEIGSNSIDCDVCKARAEVEGHTLSTATMRCLECQENLCDKCSRMHRYQKLTKFHQIVEIGDNIRKEEGSSRLFQIKFCQIHNQQILNYYCTQCKKIVCVSCFVESHSTHGREDVNTVENDFRTKIQTRIEKLRNRNAELSSKRNTLDDRKREFLEIVDEKEKLILQRSKEFKELIDQHTKSLLEELSSKKKKVPTATLR